MPMSKKTSSASSTSASPFDVEVVFERPTDTRAIFVNVYVVDGPNQIINYSKKLGIDKNSNVGSRVIIKSHNQKKDDERVMIVAMNSVESPQSSVKNAAQQTIKAVGDLISASPSTPAVALDLSGIANARTQKRFVFYVFRWLTSLRIPERLSGRKLIVIASPDIVGTGNDKSLRRSILTIHHAAAFMNMPANVASSPTDMAHMLGQFASVIVKTNGINNSKSKTKGSLLSKKDIDFKSRVLDARELRKLGMGLVLAVGSASSESAPACVLVLEAGAPAAKAKRTVLLVGKGIMYDTGGLAVKPQHHMYGMHGDKSGAVMATTVLALCAEEAAANDVRIVSVAPLTENAVGSRAIRPGDVVQCHDGRGVEIVDPDAEGRLVLADALSYGIRTFKPDLVLDFATMTITGELYHPSLTAAVFTTDGALYDLVHRVGNEVGEQVWRMPSWTEDRDAIISSQASGADVRNAGWDQYSDGYSASLFLHSFVERASASFLKTKKDKEVKVIKEMQWMHLDVSGTAIMKGPGVPFYGAAICLGEASVKEWMRR